MKKNALAVLLPVAAGVALSGTGFGVWVFSNKIEAKNAYVGFQVEPAVNFTKFEKVEATVKNANDTGITKRIVLDQDYVGLKSNAWSVTIDWTLDYEMTSGFYGIPDSNGTYDFSSSITATKTDIDNVLGSLEIEASYNIGGNLSKYIECTNPGITTFNLAANGYNIKHNFDTKQITGQVTFDFIPTSTYNAVKTIDLYKTMVSELKSSSSLSFTLEFINNLVK